LSKGEPRYKESKGETDNDWGMGHLLIETYSRGAKRKKESEVIIQRREKYTREE